MKNWEFQVLNMLTIVLIFLLNMNDELIALDIAPIEEEPLSTDLEIPVPVQAVAGGRLSLPCDITSPIMDDEVYLVLWYKDDVATPIYSLDARRGHLGQARHATNEALSSRAFFSSVPQPAVLEIDRVSLEDEGIYRCRVDFRKARTQHSALIVSVAVPPGEPIIKDHNGKILNGVIGPFSEGDSLRLICQAEGGKPSPSLIWWKSRRIIDDGFEVVGQVTRNELFIENLQRRDLMTTLTCQATNNIISPALEASVTLDIHYKPLSVHVKGKRKKLSAKKTVQFECEARGSRPPAVISWRKGSFKLKDAVNRVSAQGNVTTSILTTTPSSDDNGKFLYCQADNPEISGSSIEDGWKLDVHYVPQLNLRLGSKLRHSNIIEDTDVYFECNVRANPWVSETGWRFEGYHLENNASAGIVISNQSLVLQKVSREQRGRYSCTATNNEGQGESNHVYLRVQYSPVCKTDHVTTFSTMINQPVTLTCEVEADPDEVDFRWEFNGTSTGGSMQVLTIPGSTTSSLLTYTPKSEADFGHIYCWGTNIVGTQNTPCIYSIDITESSTEISNCSLIEVTENSITIHCNSTSQNSKECFNVDMQSVHNDGFVQNFTVRNSVIELVGLKSNIFYDIKISDCDDVEKRKVFSLEVLTLPSVSTKKENDEIWLFDHNIIIYIITASLGIIVTLCLFVFCIVKSRSNGRKSKDSSVSQGNEKSPHNSEKSADSFSEGCLYSGREEDIKRENIPDVVVFSGNVKPEESERMQSFSTSNAYWNHMSLPPETEMSPQTKMKNVAGSTPWSTGDWVISPHPVEMVTLQYHMPPTASSTEENRLPYTKQVPQQTLSTIPETAAIMSTSNTLPRAKTAKQTDV